MYFEHTYKHKASYFTAALFCIFAVAAAYILADQSAAYIIVGFLVAIVLFLTYQVYSFKNKLVVGMNEEGICLWQKGNYYLFCTWDAVQHIGVRKEYRTTQTTHNNNTTTTGHWVNYIDLSYSNGSVWCADAASTYVKDTTDLYVTVLSEEPSPDSYQYLYETNLGISVDSMAQAMNVLREQYLKNRGYGILDSNQHCRCIKQHYDID